MKYTRLDTHKKQLRRLRRELRAKGGHRLCAAINALIGSAPHYKVHSSGSLPLITFAVGELYDLKAPLSTENVIKALMPYADIIDNADLMSLLWQIKYAALLKAAREGENAGLIYAAEDIDADLVNERLNPLCRKYALDADYRVSSDKTKQMMREDTTRCAQYAGTDERRLAAEYLITARHSGTSLGEVIKADIRRIYPYKNIIYYMLVQNAVALGISALTAVLAGWIAAVAVYTPAAAVAKTVIDNLLLRSAQPGRVPMTSLKEAENYEAVCVLSALVGSKADIEDGLKRLKRARLKNNTPNIRFCLLCDLPAAPEAETDADKALLADIAAAYAASDKKAAVIVRKRSYCKTMRVFQGHERKRGAIEDLIRFICGDEISFRAVYGDISDYAGVPFICALDYDTLPLMDSINTLISAAVHPDNEEYGIFAPRITTSLGASLRTGLTRLFGTGGCSGASVYDSVSAELYFDCFGEGTFTGKGLIRTDRYYKRCVGALPGECILSHDILEGGLLGTAYCGDVEFSDSMPPTTKGFFKRSHRWMRGDYQNLPFIFKKEFSALTKYKLSDNIRRAMTPLNALLTLFFTIGEKTGIPAAVAVLSVTLPFISGLIPAAVRGLGFSNTREFYAPITSLSRQLLSQLFAELIFLGKNALIGLDAMVRTAYRLITRRRLLEWQTASAFDSTDKVGYSGMLPASAVGVLLFWLAVYYSNIFTALIAIAIIFCLPAAIVCDRPCSTGLRSVKPSDRKALTDEAFRQWSFYTDYVTEREHFLPPDNVQYSPVYRVSHRTSPTNIGMYLLSCVCARELGFIDAARLEALADRTLSTVLALPKYKGNLYNWYSTTELSVIDPFVSSVDSGNLLCCLTAVKERLSEDDAQSAAARKAQKLIAEADIGIFYNKARKLFSVGINADTGEKAPNCYDMLMSEARMLSFFAIASGKADRQHWRALARIMSRSGHYAGPVAWSGTMFEYFMPELLLESKRGSLCYEALGYAVHCQKERSRRELPFGVSESGYFAFDRDLNYQYKAHGVQKLALCAGMDREYVISPYSTFLALQYSFSLCMRNFSRLAGGRLTEKLSLSHEKYGLYEAIDMTGARTGASPAVVKSHMAHHIGMSMCGITNALCGGRLRALFMNDETMQRADELLEERVMSGEIIVDIEKIRDRSALSDHSEEYTEMSVLRPRVNITANHSLALLLTDTGLYRGFFSAGGISRACAFPTRDMIKRPDGMFFGIREGAVDIPFYVTAYDAGMPIKRSAVFGENHTEYHTECAGLVSGMRVSVFGEEAAEIREIRIRNDLSMSRSFTFYAYMRFALAPERDITAHPAFAELFIKPERDTENDLILVCRRDIRGGRETWAAIGFKHTEDMIYAFGRENVLTSQEPMDFSKGLGLTASDPAGIPSPCVFISVKAEAEEKSEYENTLFICYGESREEVTALSKRIRAYKEKEAPPSVSPLPKSTLAGRTARRALPSVLYKNVVSEEILLKRSRLSGREDINALRSFGISGDLPILVYEHCGDDTKTNGAVMCARGLAACGIPCDTVILTEKPMPELKGPNVYPIALSGLTEAQRELITGCASCLPDSTHERKAPSRLMDIVPCEPLNSGVSDGFRDNGYIITGKGHPLCNVLASREFGCVLSQNSLGFSYAMNSRENKLTPWYNDILRDNDGELLLIRGTKGRGRYHDIIKGSRAVFSPNKADYLSKIGKLGFKTSVRVYQKGMGKKITLTVTNGSDIEKQISVSYYTEPVMGSGSTAGILTFRAGKRFIAVRSFVDPEFKGEMAISCDRECVFATNAERFFAGEPSDKYRERPCSYAKSCAAVTSKLRIPPHSSAALSFIMAYSRSDAAKMLDALERQAIPEETEYRPEPLGSGSDTLDRLYAHWLPWQVIGCRMWARSGFYQNGGAYGFRDQLQDSMAAAYFLPKEAKRQLLRACAAQFEAGDVLHWWHKTNAGRKGVRTKCSDDMLWLPCAAAEYARITGDKAVFSLPVPYAEGEELAGADEKYMSVGVSEKKGTVYDHCKKAFGRCLRTGSRSLIKIGTGDWNDGFNKVGVQGMGESVWLSQFYIAVSKLFIPTARERGDEAFACELEKNAAALTAAVEDEAFENGYYLRAFYDNGEKMGAKGSECCEIDLLPQAFAVFAGLPDEKRKESALKAAYERLCDERGKLISLFAPPFFRGSAQDPGYIRGYPEGIRENGGQYTHAAVWLALAFLRSGDKPTAKRLADMLNPAERTPAFKNEPYYMTADISTNPECRGRGGWSLYTGAAGWYYRLLREIYKE